MSKIARFRTEDGRIARFSVPDDFTQEQAQAKMQEFFAKSTAQAKPQAAPQPAPFESGATRAGKKAFIGLGRGFTDLIESGKQLFADTFGDETAAEKIRQDAIRERAEFAQTPVGQSTAGQVGRFAGNVLPSIAIPGAAATLPGRIGLGAVTGAGLGFSGFRPEETPEARLEARKSQALTTGAVGAVIPPALALGKAAVQPIQSATAVLTKGRILSKEFKDTGKLLREFGMKGTIGGKSASEFMINLESTLRGGTSESIKQGINTANTAIVNAFKSFKSRLGTRQFHQVGDRIFKASERAIDKLNSTRVAEFGSTMDRISRLGGRKFIRMSNLEDLLSGKVGGGLGAKSFRKTVANELDDLKSLHGGTGFISAKQLQDDLMSPLSAATVGKGKLWPDLNRDAKKELAKDLINAINKDLDHAITSGEAGPAAKLLKQARTRYAANSKPIEEIKNSVLGSLLNEPGVTAKGIGQVSAEALGKKLNKMDPGQLSRTMHILRKHDTKAANDIVDLRIDNALKEATKDTVGKPGNLLDIDVAKLVKELGGERNLRALLGSKAEKFLRAIKAAQRTAQVRTGKGREPIGAGAQVAGTVVAPTPTFLAINLARVLGPIGLRRALLDPKGQDAIIKMARAMGQPKRFQKELTAATAVLSDFKDQ